MRVLMILYRIPPQESIAATRVKRLIQGLTDHGVEPVLVAPGRHTAEESIEIAGKRIQTYRFKGRDLVGDRRIKRIGRADSDSIGSFKKLKRIVKSFMLPDTQRALIPGWVASGTRGAQTGVHAVFSSSAPYSTHLAAKTLSRELKLPWVMEMRDMWSGNRYLPQITNPVTRAAMEWWEQRCLDAASRVVVLTQAHRDRLIRKQSNCREKTRVVPNMFPDLSELQRNQSTKGKLRILYAGNLYGGRSLKSIGKAVDSVQHKLPGFDGAVLEVAGRSYDEPWEKVLGGMNENRIVHGVLDQASVLQMMGNVHAGVVNNAAWDRIHIPGKFYDYMAAALPVLDLTHQPDIPGVGQGIAPVWKISDESSAAETLVELAQWWQENPNGGNPPELNHGRAISNVGRIMAGVLREVAGARA